MKKYIIILLLVISGISYAQKKIITKAKVSHVNVYSNSAGLKNTAEVLIPKGSSEIIISNISDKIIEKSIQIGINNKNVSVLSTQFSRNYNYKFDEKTNKNPKLKKINEDIKSTEKKLVFENIKLQTNKKTLELLDKNQTLLIGSKSSNVAELKALAEYYTTKRTELSKIAIIIDENYKKLREKLYNLKKQLKNQKTDKEENLSDGVLVVKVMSLKKAKTTLKINYLASGVSWRPTYEIKATSVNKPLNINLKAIIRQNTGVNWNNIKLNLINGSSYRTNYAPEPQTWFLNAYVNNKRRRFKKSKGYSVAKAEVTSDEEESYELNDVSVVQVTTNENQLNTSFNIPMKFTVKSNNKEHIVSLSNQEIKADFKYYTIPKYNKEAFLIAKIKDFSKYDLIPAKASIIFENMYIGETYLNPNNTSGDLKITLGNDPKIGIKKVVVKEKSGGKFLSNKTIKTFTYDLIVKNNKSKKIKIEIKDIYPISNNDKIEVELTEISGAKKDKEKGFFTWDISLRKNEIKKLRVSYKITYPKDMVVPGL